MADAAGDKRFIGAFFAGLGTLAVAVGLWFLADAMAFDDIALSARGEVLSVERHQSVDKDTGQVTYTYTPTFRFVGQNGDTYQAETHVAASVYNFRIGTQKDLLYDPARPDEVRLTGFGSRYGLPLGFIVGGLIFAGVGVGLLITGRRRGR
ncbi:MAG: DUF3592 domain-containing protein [Pseudomonadota bacterium]